MRLCSRRRAKLAFTLAEILVTVTVLLMILVFLAQFIGQIDGVWKSTATDPFADARGALDTVARNLASATLEPYQDYVSAAGAFRNDSTFVPDHLARRSDLAFACGQASGSSALLSTRTCGGSCVFFLAPQGSTQTAADQGLPRLLNAMGYFIEFGDDNAAPSFSFASSHRWRWRLRQVRQPSEALQVFANTTTKGWIQQLVPSGATFPIVAENIIAFIVEPERAADDSGAALAPAFAYDSRDTTNPLTLYQLPPRLRLVLVALDEVSAQRLAAISGNQPPPLVPATLFQAAALLDTDVSTLDASLTTQHIGHRIFQREILLPSAAWSSVAASQ